MALPIARLGRRRAMLLDGAARYLLDETVQERVVGDRHRNAGDQCAYHDLAPEENVAPDEICRDAKRNRLFRCLATRT
jgi:hypothetical protein